MEVGHDVERLDVRVVLNQEDFARHMVVVRDAACLDAPRQRISIANVVHMAAESGANYPLVSDGNNAAITAERMLPRSSSTFQTSAPRRRQR